MIRVAALTPGRHVPSARFRVRQYVRDLRRIGIEVDEYIPRIDKYARLPGWPKEVSQLYAAPAFAVWQGIKLATRVPGIVGSWKHQVTWLQRDLLPGLPTLEALLGGPLLFDVDDAVWLKKPYGREMAQRIARRSVAVIAGNDFVADWFSNYAREVRVVPTAIDSRRFRPAESSDREDDEFTIGWTGTASSFPYLDTLIGSLRRFLVDHPEARFLLMAERLPDLDLPAEQVRFWRWSEREEVAAVQSMDVGLMPLTDDAWARGKCSFKMLQYMACGVPAIVSPIGTNRRVLSHGDSGIAAESSDDWYDALHHLYHHRDEGRRLGSIGRRVVEEHYDRQLVARRLAEVFQEFAEERGASRKRLPLQATGRVAASRLPNFFIVGAPKCGTTAMHRYLSEHPEVFMTEFKEPHYFAQDISSPYYVRSLRHYQELFAPAQPEQKLLGEASVWYLFSRVAIPKIRQQFPSAKLVVMLRNPVDLFVSFHNQALASLFEDQADPKVAWSLQEVRRQGARIPSLCDEPRLLQYAEVCQLGQQVDRLFQRVPRDQVLPLLFDDFARDPASTYREVLSFLGLRDDERRDFPRINEAYELKMPLLEKARRYADRVIVGSPWLRLLASPSQTLVRPISLKVRRLNQKRVRRAPLDQEFRAQLLEFFKPDIERLAGLLDRDLSHWTRS